MKKTVLLFLLTVSMVFAVSASIGTFTGETVNEGPEAEYFVGLASDQNLTVELEIPEIEGLNISYNEKTEFKPGEADQVYQRGQETLPVQQYSIIVESEDVTEESYSFPVTFRAYSEEDREGTRPYVIHEREYSFNFVTDLSPSYGWDGSLIGDEDNDIDETEESVNQSGEELDLDDESESSLTEGNQTVDGEEEESSTDRTTLILLVLILLLALYILKEAFT